MAGPELPSHWRWRDGPVEPGPAVVFDLDGVLSDAAGRQHFLDHGSRDWRGFFDACGDDALIEEVARLIELLDPALLIVLLTARPLRVQPQTLAWLERYGLRWDLLIMRGHGETTRAAEFKVEAVVALRSAGFELCLAFEDDRRNVDAFHARGVPCIYIHSGYYE